jgi:hypothetical protein
MQSSPDSHNLKTTVDELDALFNHRARKAEYDQSERRSVSMAEIKRGSPATRQCVRLNCIEDEEHKSSYSIECESENILGYDAAHPRLAINNSMEM